MKKTLLLVFMVVILVLPGCFDKSDDIVLDRISSVNDTQDFSISFTLENESASKLQV